eukprot:318070_1
MAVLVVLICILNSFTTNAMNTDSFDDITFDYETNENYNGFIMNTGWLKFFDCKEGNSAASFPKYHNDYTLSELVTLSKYAISVKFLTGTGIPGVNENTSFALTTNICSEPIFSLNNGYELSYTLDHNTLRTVNYSHIS